MSSSNSSTNFFSGIDVSEKLGKVNHALWKAEVRSAIRGARLQGHITGDTKAPEEELVATVEGKVEKRPNPAFEEWEAKDQQVLRFLLSSLTKEVKIQVSTCEIAVAVWNAIEQMYASQTRARTVNIRIALANTKKGNSTAAEYFAKMKALGDEMAAAGRRLDDEELVEYILTGLGEDYTSLVTTLTARVEPITVGELYSQLLNFETRMDLTYRGNSLGSGSANAASRGRGGFARGGRNQGGHGGQNNQRGRGRDSASARGRGNVNNASQRGGGRGGYNNNHHRAPPSDGDERPLCQVCFKSGHTTDRCWHRYNENYVPDPKLVAAAMNSYTIDNNWYTDTGATDHITGELEKLSFRNKYNGGDQIHTASGAGSGNEEYNS
ncbi:uncharacterized protein LOC110431234 [Sorghum bicolor]|uniref:uncharacterized protein LOC110431234 n=1 Tax=Sorghum bicolor TaxID=4558 RepID=UPI000B4244AF|nr:uncharacterized protein LOC110431234 [Sorghum bicolor]|eukprot:XP_021305719.1 uncharacterized protein LOC110431234 [Sorghum bicolor]